MLRISDLRYVSTVPEPVSSRIQSQIVHWHAKPERLAKPGQFDVAKAILALRSGNTDALELLYETYRMPFFRWAGRRFQAQQHDIEDAWQEAVTAFFEQLRSGRLTELRHPPRTWLFAVGYRQLAKANRKTKRILWRDAIDEALLQDNELVDFQWDSPAPDEWQAVNAALQSLSPQCREILTMRFYQGKKITEIMAALGHNSENTTSATLSRCLKKLKDVVNRAPTTYDEKQ